MESSSFSQHFLTTDLVTSSVPPSVASSSEESSNDSTAPWKADIASSSMNGSTSPHTTIFQSDHSLVEIPRSLARPSRESVLQRLSESLLRRSLTKVRLYEDFSVGLVVSLVQSSPDENAVLMAVLFVFFLIITAPD